MNRDVICVDGEIKTVSSEIINNLESLLKSVNTYNRTLKYVQKTGIQDEVIRGKLGNLATLLKSYQETLDSMLQKYQSDEKAFLSDIEANDTFSFPSSVISEIEILISMFC